MGAKVIIINEFSLLSKSLSKTKKRPYSYKVFLVNQAVELWFIH
jgi:hypothetical protein